VGTVVAQQVGPQRLKREEDVGKVEEPGRVQRGVGGVRREGQGQTARDEAVEGCVKVAGEGRQYAPCRRADCCGASRRTYRVAALISPGRDTGGWSFCTAGGALSPFSSIVAVVSRGDRGESRRDTRRKYTNEAQKAPDSSQKGRHTRSPHAHRSLDDAGLSAHMHPARVVCRFDAGWVHWSRLRNMLDARGRQWPGYDVLLWDVGVTLQRAACGDAWAPGAETAITGSLHGTAAADDRCIMQRVLPAGARRGIRP
jgi:hypothetical protein